MKEKVLITGATGNLGNSLCKYLSKKGWSLLLTGTNYEKLNLLKSDLLAKGFNSSDIDVFSFDLLDKQKLKSIDKYLLEKGFQVSHIVNNARSLLNLEVDKCGISESNKFLSEIEIGVVSPYTLIMQIFKNKNHPLKAVVNVGSQYGCVAPNTNLYDDLEKDSAIQYGVAKAALHHLTKELAIRLAPDVRVNCVAFGGVEGRASKDFKERYAKLNPHGRMLKIDEVGGPINFLLNEKESSSINGHILVADLGWTIW